MSNGSPNAREYGRGAVNDAGEALTASCDVSAYSSSDCAGTEAAVDLDASTRGVDVTNVVDLSSDVYEALRYAAADELFGCP